jgi:hypothetical protein
MGAKESSELWNEVATGLDAEVVDAAGSENTVEGVATLARCGFECAPDLWVACVKKAMSSRLRVFKLDEPAVWQRFFARVEYGHGYQVVPPGAGLKLRFEIVRQ